MLFLYLEEHHRLASIAKKSASFIVSLPTYLFQQDASACISPQNACGETWHKTTSPEPAQRYMIYNSTTVKTSYTDLKSCVLDPTSISNHSVSCALSEYAYVILHTQDHSDLNISLLLTLATVHRSDTAKFVI